MPKYLKFIARYANSIIALLLIVTASGGLAKGSVDASIAFLFLATLLMFNLYLIEKAATLLSEEEWLKAQIRKTLLRKRLANLHQQERARASGGHGDKSE